VLFPNTLSTGDKMLKQMKNINPNPTLYFRLYTSSTVFTLARINKVELELILLTIVLRVQIMVLL